MDFSKNSRPVFRLDVRREYWRRYTVRNGYSRRTIEMDSSKNAGPLLRLAICREYCKIPQFPYMFQNAIKERFYLPKSS